MAENYYYSSLSGDEIEQTLLGAVRFNVDQSLTTSQKAAARANIGAGESNSTFKVLGYFDTLEEMQESLQTLPELGDAYGIGTESPYDVYVYAMHMVDGQAVPGWVNQGPIDTSAAAFDDEDISTRTGWTSSKIASELTNVQRRLVIDDVPTLGSGNPVASGGVAVKMEWKKIVSENVSVPVNRWTSSAKYDGYGFRAQIPIENVTADMIPEVIFDPADVSTGTFATIAESYNGGIYIYASEVPSAAITIPTIIVWRGDTGDGSDIPLIQIDPTLTVAGAAADAKAAGDAIRANTTTIGALQTTVDGKAGALVDTASGAIASFVPDATIDNLLGVTVAVELVQAGSGDPSPDNVRPISGWTGAKVTRTGKNVIPNLATSGTSKGITYTVNADKSISLSGTANGNVFISLFENLLIKAGTYTLKGTSDSEVGINIRKETAAGSNYVQAYMSDITTTFATDVQIACVVRISSGKNANGITIYPQLELGSAATAYEPYQAETYSITFPSSAGTVYGGTLDVTTGKLTVDRAMVDLGAETWTRQATGNTYRFVLSGFHTLPGAKTTGGYDSATLCSMYPSNSAPIGSNNVDDCYAVYNGVVLVRDDSYNTADAFKTAMSGVQLCYELATPVVIQLDPVTIATISGQTNNVWSDAGDVDVTFAADIKAYIDRLNQPTEDDMIANTLIAANKYFTVNNRLFLSTASIAAGAQIIPGDNCTETSLAAALNALNA